MSYHPRIESSEFASFLTTRSRNSELWFVNNPALENAILGYAAKFSQRYNVALYALAIEGNHIQGPAHFPNCNRASFMRDLNSAVARAVPRYAPEYPGGRFWGRRYSAEFLPAPEDIEEYFFYTVLQPVQDGLVERISDYPGYNCFHDAIHGVARTFKVVRWADYYNAVRANPRLSVEDFTDCVTLKYTRIPGYENHSRQEYVELMKRKLEERRSRIVAERRKQGLCFAGKSTIQLTKRGATPTKTKRSSITSHRPRVLSKCPLRRATVKAWYFQIYAEYRSVSARYRAGEWQTPFPEGTYRPPYWKKYFLDEQHSVQ